MLRVYAAALGVDMASIQWFANTYIIVTCAALLVFGRLGDMYGKVRIFQPGVALFTLGSALCALSGTFEMLVFSRAVQSLGITVGSALLYGGMSDSIGCPVTSYVEGHPDVFMTACTPLSWLLAFIEGASAMHASRRGVTRVLQSESA